MATAAAAARAMCSRAPNVSHASGDTSLYDGCALPRRMPQGTDLGRARLPLAAAQALRRGLEDALSALAAEVDARAASLNRRHRGRVLDERKPGDATDIDLRPEAFEEARSELRALIASAKARPRGDAVSIAAALEELRAMRRYERSRAVVGVPPSELARTVVAFFLPLGLLLFGWAAVAILNERKPQLRGSARAQS